MFCTLAALLPHDTDYPERTFRLNIFQRVLDGTIYDCLPYEFHEERSAGGEYIPLRQRKPSVKYALPKIVVEDSVALLFSDGHFPRFESNDSDVRIAAARLVQATRLNAVMTDAAIRGSVGSIAILMRILRGRVFLDALDTLYLTPAWEIDAPDSLNSVTERYKVGGAELIARGYDIADPGGIYWFSRCWDSEWERWFNPIQVGEGGVASVDWDRSLRHGLGFVPFIWIKNLPGGNSIDGACTFRAAIDASIEIDYQLSQAGRGLKYTVPPTTYSNDAWASVGNQFFPVTVNLTGTTAVSSGVTQVPMASVANISVGQAVGLNGATNTPAQAIAPGTSVVGINTSSATVTLSSPTVSALAAGTKLYFGSQNAASSPLEMQRQAYNAFARANWKGGGGGCSGLIDVDNILADQGGTAKWRTDLGQASADGVHPSAVLHQALVNSGAINAGMFALP